MSFNLERERMEDILVVLIPIRNYYNATGKSLLIENDSVSWQGYVRPDQVNLLIGFYNVPDKTLVV